MYPTPATHRGQISTASAIELVAAAWLLASPFVLHFTKITACPLDVFVGGFVMLFAAIRVWGGLKSMWLSWLSLFCGLLVAISPLIMGFANYGVATASNVATGIVILVMAGWAAFVTPPRDYDDNVTPHAHP